ncbi:MAG: signal peptide peptidase SppA [Pirellulales bacterium]|nr:signal peptide peptidase SppA [Pirellulales bacterium]
MIHRDAYETIWLSLLLLAVLAITAPLRATADEPAAKEPAAKEPAKQETADSDSATKDATPEKKKTQTVRLANIVVTGDLSETAGGGSLLMDLGTDLRQTMDRLDKAAKDDSIAGILLEIKDPAIGRGRLHEFTETIARVRKSGKKVHAYLESADTGSYLLACACDDITIPESGDMILPGVYLEATYYKGLLDKLGIQADFLHMGEAKGAAEPITRKKMSPAVRENLTNMVDDLYNQMLETVARQRRIPVEKVRALVDSGLLSATEVKKAGLIDRVAYANVLRENLKTEYAADKLVYVINYGKKKVDQDFSGTMGLIKLMQAIMGVETPKTKSKAPTIAIVYAVGPILSGKSQSSILGEQVMGSDTIVEALKESAEDEQVAAIILRIDSPGGSALASDMIWQQTQVVKKPIIASMSDVAASGGYYIAVGCNKIYAEPSTITGSIGVVGGKLALGGLYKKIGVTTDVIARGKNAGLFSSTRLWNEAERDEIHQMMENIYGQFTKKVAKGRRMPHERVLELAGGKVYTGRDAKQYGLIDELGTLKDAIADAKTLAGIDKDDEVQLKILPETPNFFEMLFEDMGEEHEARAAFLARQLPPEILEPLRKAARIRMLFRDPISLVMPYDLEIN